MMIRRIYRYFLFSLFLLEIYGQSVSDSDFDDLDWSVRPADDFFTFVNGRWINRTIIPRSQTQWGGFHTLIYETSLQLKSIFDDLTKNGTMESIEPMGSAHRKLADLYLAGMDEEELERVGLQPLEETFLRLDQVNSYQDLLSFVLHRYVKTDQGLIFKLEVYADERDTTVNVPIWKQTGIGLPEKSLYFDLDGQAMKIRQSYRQYIHRLLQLTDPIVNQTTTLDDADLVLTLEMILAASHQTTAEKRDFEGNYHRYTIDQLDKMMPNLHWYKIREILNIKNYTFLMNQPNYYLVLNKLIADQPLKIWKNKIRYTILHEMSKYLNRDCFHAYFQMFEKVIYGRIEPEPRWMRLIDDITTNIGELLGQVYVSRYFAHRAKQKTLDLFFHLLDVYRQRLLDNPWMNSITKKKAIRKLNKINPKIGYPSTWKSYDDVKINRWSYFDSVSSIFEHNFREKIIDLGKPPDRDQWWIAPQTVNAFYDLSFNEIIFPAAILQEPYFSIDADDAHNYGAAGYIIAHELTHCFDDQGRKYDENGHLNSWWTLNDIEQFRNRSELLIEQYNQYRELNITVNGRLTLGENIADLGGLEVAFSAFTQTQEAKENRLVDGFTAKERFFMSYARTWRIKFTEAQTLHSLKIDPHAPVKARINGPLSNMEAFYEVFRVKPGDGLYREPSKRVKIL